MQPNDAMCCAIETPTLATLAALDPSPERMAQGLCGLLLLLVTCLGSGHWHRSSGVSLLSDARPRPAARSVARDSGDLGGAQPRNK